VIKEILNILLIDDNPADRKLTKLTLANALQAIEFVSETAGTPAEAGADVALVDSLPWGCLWMTRYAIMTLRIAN